MMLRIPSEPRHLPRSHTNKTNGGLSFNQVKEELIDRVVLVGKDKDRGAADAGTDLNP
jgi:hypothetical protein